MSNYNNLAEAVMDYLQEEIEDIEEDVKEVTDELTKQAVQELKQSSKAKFKGTGGYAKSWKRQIINPWSRKKYSKYLTNRRYVVRIHNKDYYMLTHLLEFGHATRGGGRTKAVPHIRPIEEKYNKMYETRITTAIRTRAYDNKGRWNKGTPKRSKKGNV